MTDVFPLGSHAWTLPAPGPTSTLCFGEYEVIAEIGEGGMGRVYKAIDRSLGRHVAVKVLRSTDEFEASRFRGEAEMIALLDHPNIVKIFSIDTTPDCRPYIALEFAEGGSLDKELGGKPMEPRRAAEMAEIMARAIHYAHEKGVIHRDLKPANVLRGKDGVLKITDFGLAKQLEVSSGMTPTGAVMGTPSYMAPEQAEGKVKTLGPPTDVYGLGAILYEMLTGRPPFRGANLVETLEQVRWMEPAAPSQFVPRLHRDLSTICLKCLRKTPGQRYATAGEFADDLRHWLNGETIVARSAASWEKVWRQVKRRPWQAATILVSAVVAGLLVFGAIYVETQHRKEVFQAELDKQNALAQEEKERNLKTIADNQLKSAQKLRKRSNETLVALDSIREMMLRGELRNVSSLGPLRNNLFVYYKRLNDELLQEGDYDKNTLAKSWLEVGRLIQETGRKDYAWEAFKKARDLFRTVTPETPESRFNLAEAEGKCGRLALELNLIKEAKDSCDAVEALLTGTEENRRCAGELAEMWHLRAEVLDSEREADLEAIPFTLA